jgi:type IV pilus assembly protein PilN
MIDAQEKRNVLLRDEIMTLDKQIEQINSLEQQKEQMVARMQIIEKLQQSRPEIVHIFDTFTRLLPDGMYLTALTQTDQRLKIQGITQSPSRVSTFLNAIDESEWLKEAELEVIEEKTAGNEFVLYAKQRVSATEQAATLAAKDKRKKP